LVGVLCVKTPVLTAPGGRGSLYLDKSQDWKKNRDFQERSELTFHTGSIAGMEVAAH
jgi:hypothetical protein